MAEVMTTDQSDGLSDWIIEWGTSKHTFQLHESQSMKDVQELLEAETSVPVAKQKILGLKTHSKKPVTQETLVKDFKARKNKFKMVGSAVELKPPSELNLPQILDDMEWDFVPDYTKMSKVHDKYEKKISELVEKSEINIIHAPRPGKKLLVLDLDNTLFDMKGMRKTPNQLDLKRPFTDHFLRELYPYYDFVIWSQTAWRWIEIKLTELQIIPHFKISFILDKSQMPRVCSATPRGMKTHQIKPLELIWRRFPDYYGPHNTVHVDDLGRNFLYNPQQGLKCTPYKHAKRNRLTDVELRDLTDYFLLIKDLASFKHLNHDDWRAYLSRNR